MMHQASNQVIKQSSAHVNHGFKPSLVAHLGFTMIELVIVVVIVGILAASRNIVLS